MLEPLRHILDGTRIVLASASPRRREILENVQLKLDIQPSDVEENLPKEKYTEKPWAFAMDTAELKADDIYKNVKGEMAPDAALLVIGSDTVVTLDEKIYGKPSDEGNARATLAKLSNRTHKVYSGVKLIYCPGDTNPPTETKFYEVTSVEMSNLSEAVIAGYVATKEPMDKAGGYGIQGIGGSLVRGIQGDYFNVMGFPLHRFCVELTKLLGESGQKKDSSS